MGLLWTSRSELACSPGVLLSDQQAATGYTTLITREYNGQTFTFREDGYFNMTRAAKAFGRELKHFWESISTRDYCFELSRVTGLYSAESADLSYGLADIKRGRYGGTWGHPKLAVFFARWLDPKFAVFCDMVIDDILNKKAELTITKPAEAMTPKVIPTHLDTARELVAALEEAERLKQENLRLAGSNQEMAPKAEAFDTYIDSTGYHNTTQAAAALGFRPHIRAAFSCSPN